MGGSSSDSSNGENTSWNLSRSKSGGSDPHASDSNSGSNQNDSDEMPSVTKLLNRQSLADALKKKKAAPEPPKRATPLAPSFPEPPPSEPSSSNDAESDRTVALSPADLVASIQSDAPITPSSGFGPTGASHAPGSFSPGGASGSQPQTKPSTRERRSRYRIERWLAGELANASHPFEKSLGELLLAESATRVALLGFDLKWKGFRTQYAAGPRDFLAAYTGLVLNLNGELELKSQLDKKGWIESSPHDHEKGSAAVRALRLSLYAEPEDWVWVVQTKVQPETPGAAGASLWGVSHLLIIVTRNSVRERFSIFLK
jgi:hypothetical protein